MIALIGSLVVALGCAGVEMNGLLMDELAPYSWLDAGPVGRRPTSWKGSAGNAVVGC